MSCYHAVEQFVFQRKSTELFGDRRGCLNHDDAELEKELTISEVQRVNRQALAVTVFRLRAALSSAADTDGNIAYPIYVR